MRVIKRRTVASALLLGILTGNGVLSASAQSPNNSSTPSGASPGEVQGAQERVIAPGLGQSPGTQPPKHEKYECKMNSCTCLGAKDCGVMGADHVCMEGTFHGDAVGGSCTEKKI
jgi:hypothetical protein